MLNKEEYIKKTKEKIKRTKVTVESWYTGQDIVSKIKDLDLDVVELEGNEYFDVLINKIEICHQVYKVDYHFLYRPLCDMAEIKNCKYLDDGFYKTKYLMSLNSYDMWCSHFREIMWCVSKSLNGRYIEYAD